MHPPFPGAVNVYKQLARSRRQEPALKASDKVRDLPTLPGELQKIRVGVCGDAAQAGPSSSPLPALRVLLCFASQPDKTRCLLPSVLAGPGGLGRAPGEGSTSSIPRDTDGVCPMPDFSKTATCFPCCGQGQCRAAGQSRCRSSRSIGQHQEPPETRGMVQIFCGHGVIQGKVGERHRGKEWECQRGWCWGFLGGSWHPGSVFASREEMLRHVRAGVA